jgi:DNA-binding GntR family transcriptional regulator
MSPDSRVDLITDAFRKRIQDGEFGTAGRLPSLRMLAEQFGTTHETMNKVIQRLQAEGLLRSQGRAGVFVNSAQLRLPGMTKRFDLYLLEQGLTPVETDIVKPSIVSASQEVAAALDLTEGSPVVQRFRRQGTSIEPLRLAENFYPLELAGGEILEAMQSDVHFDVLKAIQEAHHKVIGRVHDEVFGRLETPQEQELLKIVRNTPVFETLRTSYTAGEDDIVIMYSRITSVARHFVLTYDYSPDFWTNKV